MNLKILALDTSALTASAALLDGNTVTGEISFTCALNHSQTIMESVDALLRRLALTPKDVDLFACANGPGSFTGLRIGIGTVKGLAFGADKMTVGVPTLLALAHNVSVSDCLIAPIMDARRSQVYNALYRSENGILREVCPPRAVSVEDLCGELNEKTLFVGDGVNPYREKITELLGGNALFAPPNLCLQSAASVALAARDIPPVSAAELGAVYLRKSQAEREREEKKGNE